jgi:hypothetical protein
MQPNSHEQLDLGYDHGYTPTDLRAGVGTMLVEGSIGDSMVMPTVPDDGVPDVEPALTDRMAAEVLARESLTADAQHLEAIPDGCVAVLLAGRIVRVLPLGMWRSSAMRGLNTGNFDAWARQVLAGDDYETVWLDIDPTNDEVNDMFGRWKKITGQDSPGKSPRSPRS